MAALPFTKDDLLTTRNQRIYYILRTLGCYALDSEVGALISDTFDDIAKTYDMAFRWYVFRQHMFYTSSSGHADYINAENFLSHIIALETAWRKKKVAISDGIIAIIRSAAGGRLFMLQWYFLSTNDGFFHHKEVARPRLSQDAISFYYYKKWHVFEINPKLMRVPVKALMLGLKIEEIVDIYTNHACGAEYIVELQDTLTSNIEEICDRHLIRDLKILIAEYLINC